jgi:hypothetical protein
MSFQLLIVLVLVFCGSTTDAATSNRLCDQPVTTTAVLNAAGTVAIRSGSCPAGGDKFHVVLELVVDGKVAQTEQLSAEGIAYTVSIDSSLDIDGDGVQDVGVANGAGRGGDGMVYWVLKRDPFRLMRAGEAPRLSLSTDGGRTLYALVPGSGDVQATRSEYQVREGQLRRTRALQFVPIDDANTEIRELVHANSSASEASWTQKNIRRVSGEEARRCMDGGVCP